MLNYHPPVRVLIDYKDVLTSLEYNVTDDTIGMQFELKELLSVMIFQYFSRYSTVLQERQTSCVYWLLEGSNEMQSWENSDIAMDITLQIVKITQLHLPHFNAHDSQDCAGILNVTMHSPHVAILTIDPVAFDRFMGKNR